jgi:hypothetical protein
VGVFFQLIIGKIDVRHDGPFTGQTGTKNIYYKGTKTQRIYLLFFLRAWVPSWQNWKSFVKKSTKFNFDGLVKSLL